MRKLGHTEVMHLAQGHTARNDGSNPGSMTPEPWSASRVLSIDYSVLKDGSHLTCH